MTPTRETPITIYINPAQGGKPEVTTWGAFVDANDADIVKEVEAQLLLDNYAELGGGAFPVTWIFA